MVLEDVTELYGTFSSSPFQDDNHEADNLLTWISDYSGNHTQLKKILLNGNNICMVSCCHRRQVTVYKQLTAVSS